ncbi:MAG: iron export ABC transporter permease subunit FetB [Bacteroidota bacterium]|nr:iron export ABC transporter permease subunit FetB [Bacteroidota bacterium]
MNGIIDISWEGLAVSTVFVLLAGVTSLTLRLGLEKDLLWGALRTVAQLYLMGFVLRYVFGFDAWYLVCSVYVIMIALAAVIVKGRVKRPLVRFVAPVFFSMLLSYLVVTMLVTSVIVRVKPWYDPVYFIPLGGMVIGNSISAVALALERLFEELRLRRDEIELRLCLGASAAQASATVFRSAVRAGMIPSISSMMGVGIVWIPGMMTGQILAGASPLAAVKYQIVVMFMLVGATTVSTVMMVTLVRRKCFTDDERLIRR